MTRKIFKNVNLEMNAKDRIIALIGRNSSGKSTAINLILGILKPLQGEVLVNEINIRDININTYYDKISIEFQECYVFSFLIYENLNGTSVIDVQNEKG